MPYKISKGTTIQQLPVTPMIDLVFNLLLFFVIATRFAEEEREVQIATLPVASQAQPLSEKPRAVLVSIDRQGACSVAGKVLPQTQRERLLRSVAATNPGRAAVIIRVDERCAWKFIAPVLNDCQQAGIRDYHVTARAGEPAH